MNERTKNITRWTVAIITVIFCLWYTLKDIDLIKLWQYIIHADYIWVILSIPVSLLSHWVRAYRWKTMLHPVTPHPKLWDLFSAVMAGYALNNVVPRGGEFLRPYLIARREKISFTSAFATIIVERFIDVLVLLLMLAGVSFAFSSKIQMALPNLPAEKLFVPVLIFMGVLGLSFWPTFVRTVLKYTIKPLSTKLYNKVSELFDKFAKGFEIVKNPKMYLRLGIESLLIWFLYTIPMWLMFFSFGFDKTHGLGFSDAVLLIVISGVAFTISPAPGAIGFFHVFIQTTLMNLYGINKEAALAYATINHGIGYIIQVGVGGLCLLRENVKKIPHQEDLPLEEPTQ